jgi:hypothetical protein
MIESFNAWTNVANSALTFNQNADATSGYIPSTPCASGATYNGIFYNPTVDYGATYLCFVQDGPSAFHISRFALVMEENSDSFWNDGGTDTGTNYFKTVSQHETGHAGGFGTKFWLTNNPDDMHFPVSSTSDGVCWPDSTYQTMCSGIGTSDWQASLEAHDIHTVQDAY